MTTKQLLDQAVAAQKRQDYVEAWAALRQYWRQRDAGESEPPKGDKQAHDLSHFHFP